MQTLVGIDTVIERQARAGRPGSADNTAGRSTTPTALSILSKDEATPVGRARHRIGQRARRARTTAGTSRAGTPVTARLASGRLSVATSRRYSLRCCPRGDTAGTARVSGTITRTATTATAVCAGGYLVGPHAGGRSRCAGRRRTAGRAIAIAAGRTTSATIGTAIVGNILGAGQRTAARGRAANGAAGATLARATSAALRLNTSRHLRALVGIERVIKGQARGAIAGIARSPTVGVAATAAVSDLGERQIALVRRPADRIGQARRCTTAATSSAVTSPAITAVLSYLSVRIISASVGGRGGRTTGNSTIAACKASSRCVAAAATLHAGVRTDATRRRRGVGRSSTSRCCAACAAACSGTIGRSGSG